LQGANGAAARSSPERHRAPVVATDPPLRQRLVRLARGAAPLPARKTPGAPRRASVPRAAPGRTSPCNR